MTYIRCNEHGCPWDGTFLNALMALGQLLVHRDLEHREG